MSLVLNSGFTIGPGVVLDANPAPPPITPISAGLLLNLDASNPASYPGSGTTWTDTISSIPFTLNNGPTYSSNNGGYLEFVPASGQWAESPVPLTGSSLSTWTVEAWHYFTGDTTGNNPCLLTDTYTSNINYALGYPFGYPNFQAGFYNGDWRVTPVGYALTPNAWYQIVGTYDGDTIKLYVNNTLINQTSYTGTSLSSGVSIRLMRRWDGEDYWGGRLSIVRIYDGALDSTGVTQNFNADRARYGL